jgi:hypothetical protein
VLFSSREVADYINATFEPAWESVRPVPTVTIDFGNGHVIKRTIQGNIATYVCGPNGIVYDVLPGIYTPTVYIRQLAACKALADSLRRFAEATPATEAGRQRVEWDLADRLRAYHTQQIAMLDVVSQAPQIQVFAPQMRAAFQGGGGFKFGGGGFNFGGGGFNGPQATSANFSGGVFGSGFASAAATPTFGGIEGPTARLIAGGSPPSVPVMGPTGPLATRPELAMDTQVNELLRRRAIHEHLARLGVVHPDTIKKWLYKEILHADLDDPLLGLGEMLNANYPFAEEERKVRKKNEP